MTSTDFMSSPAAVKSPEDCQVACKNKPLCQVRLFITSHLVLQEMQPMATLSTGQQLKAAQFYPIPLTTKTLVDWQRLAFFENFVAPFVLRRLCKSNKMKFKDAYIGLVKIKEFIAFEVNVVLIVFLSSTNGGRSEVKRNHEYNFKL